MTVKKLIEDLQNYDLDAQVLLVVCELCNNLKDSYSSVDCIGNKIVYLMGEN